MNTKNQIIGQELEYVEEIINEVFTQNNNTSIGEEKCMDLENYINQEVEKCSEVVEIVEESSKIEEKEESLVENNALIKKEEESQILRPFYFNKFPGSLHLVVETLYKVSKTRLNDDFIKIRVEWNGGFWESTECSVAKEMNPSFHMRIPLENLKKIFTLNIFIVESGSSKKVAVSAIEFDEKMINSIHNRLGEIKKIFKKITGFLGFLNNGLPVAHGCRVYCAYISKDELPTINSPNPYSLLSLSKWLVARKYAYDLMFSGFLNVKGDINDTTRFLWKLRYVKWFGYTLYIFNDKTKKIVSSVNITDALVNTTNLHKGCLSFDMRTHVLELHTDSKHNIKNIRDVLNVLFPSNNSPLKSSKF